jgi:hypothetical protein
MRVDSRLAQSSVALYALPMADWGMIGSPGAMRLVCTIGPAPGVAYCRTLRHLR